MKATATKLLAEVRIAEPSGEAEIEAQKVLTLAQGRQIVTDQDYADAGAELTRVKTQLGVIEGMRRDLKAPILEAGRKLDAFFKRPLDYLTQAEQTLKRKVYAYQQLVAQRQREAQAKADEAARKERERLERQAEAARAKGKEEKAAAIAERATQVVPVTVQERVPAVSGIQTRENWQWRVKDATKIPREYLTEDTVKIGKVVRAMKGDTSIPGIEVWNEGMIAASRR